MSQVIITICIGDTLVTATRHQSLDNNDDMPHHYTLMFTDLPTGFHFDISYTGENDLMLAVAAWIAADEGDDWFNRHLSALMLRLEGSQSKFMP